MGELYLVAEEVERTRRRAEAFGRHIVDDAWARDRLPPDEVEELHDYFWRTRTHESRLGDEDQFHPGGWLPEATAAVAVLAAFPLLELEPGWTLGTYVFRERLGGYGLTFARELGAPMRSRQELEASHGAGQEPTVDPESGVQTVLRWDPQDLAGYVWASVAARELDQLGGSWHGLYWSSQGLLGGTGTPVLAGDDAVPFGGVPDFKAFDFQTPPPARWDPQVRHSKQGVQVDLFTFGGRDGESLWRHRDVYAPGSTVPARSRTQIARGGFGYVF